MSGSGGSVYDPQPPQQTCDRLNFKTTVNSPDPAVIGGIQVGDRLDVALDTGGNRKRVVVLHNGRIAGSITSDTLPQLISCLESGSVFSADVQSVKGGRVEVHVRPGA